MSTPTLRKAAVPAFTLTQVCEHDEVGAIERRIKTMSGDLVYHHRPVDANVHSRPQAWNLFAFALDRECRPWNLATVYLLDRIQDEGRPAMATYQAAADDLGAFRHWLDAQATDLLFHFPQNKLERVTYRYLGHLKTQIFAGNIASETANHRMLTVIDFYRFLASSQYFTPDYPAWAERRIRLSFKTDYGAVVSKQVTTTDLKIKTPKANDAFRETIQDGGELRPLTPDEQLWLFQALKTLGNTEMYLMCLFMVATGARIQTACTLRLGFFLGKPKVFRSDSVGGQEVVKLKCGPGTLIDTKGDKTGVLQIPLPLFEAMRTYTHSERAKRRRLVAKGGNCLEQYFFLTNRGKPYYVAKSESTVFDPTRTSRYIGDGGTVRKFIAERVVPHIRGHHDPKFSFKIHDLRATFGMNQTTLQMALVEKGSCTLGKARDIVRQLMWHESLSTTDKYLDYRSRMEQVYAAINGYGEQVQAWIADANSVGGADE